MNSKLVQAAQFVLFCTCLTFAVFEFALEFRITGYILACLAVALLVLLAPLAAKWKIGPSGVEFERLIEEREKAEAAALDARAALEQALVLNDITMALTNPQVVQTDTYRGLEAWVRQAADNPQGIAQLSQLVHGQILDHAWHLQPAVDILVRRGLIERIDDGAHPQYRVPASRRDAVHAALTEAA